MRYLLVLLVLTVPLAACGHKGKLKTPEQIELERQKKSTKAAKEAAKAEREKAQQAEPEDEGTEEFPEEE